MAQKTRTKNSRNNTTWTAGASFVFVVGMFAHPALIELSEQFFSPLQEVFLLLCSVALTLLMFFLSKSHFICSLMQSGGLLANTAVFVLLHSHGGMKAVLTSMDYEWCFRVILMWCGGVAVTLLIRLLAHKKWNASHIRKTFSKGFLCSSIIFFILYIILLLDLFIFQRSELLGDRSLNLIPFSGAWAVYWPHIKAGHFTNGIFVQFFGNLLIFTPLGFYLALWWRKKKYRPVLYLIPVVLAAVIEGAQYAFNIGKSDVDDLWMNVLGFWIGIWICTIMDALRKKITKGKEKTIFTLPK
ncbi:MAG: VanZ family protein [Clostridiales bacterium]|nr:VanZ family protein [Clostridiales bacterium]